MKHILIAGFMSDVQETDSIKDVLSPSLDIEKMEAEEISGFNFELPQSIFPLFYQSDDIEVKIIEDVSTTDSTITVDDASMMNTGFYWIKNELVRVFQIEENATDWTLFVFRGQNLTFEQKYTINQKTGQYYYIRKYAKTFIGQRVFLYEDSKLLSIGIITKQPVFDGTVLKFSCDNALSTLDTAWSIPPGASYLLDYRETSDGESYKAVKTADLNRALGYNSTSLNESFEYEIPPIMDYVVAPLKANITSGASNNTYIPLSDLDTILDYLKLYGKLNGSVFTWDNSRELYTFVSISDVSSLDTASDVYLSKYVDITKSYSAELYTGISQIKVSLRNTVLNINNANTSQFTKSNILELDLSKFIGISPQDSQSIVYFYMRLFSIIYCKLTIPTHSIKFEDFTEGYFYNALDIDKFFTFQDVSSRVFCMSKDDDNIIFLVTRDVIKNPIVPGISVTAFSTSLEHDDILSDYLNTDERYIEDAVISNYNFPYFEVGDNVIFVRDDGVKFSGLVITSISNDRVYFSAPSWSVGDKGYLTYNTYSACTTRQRKFFFLDLNNW